MTVTNDHCGKSLRDRSGEEPDDPFTESSPGYESNSPWRDHFHRKGKQAGYALIWKSFKIQVQCSLFVFCTSSPI